ncbi:MAG: hypothetical protein U0R19_23155 [Bryobacteraceae bacterium]
MGLQWPGGLYHAQLRQWALRARGAASLLLAGGAGSSDPVATYPPNHCIGIYNFPPQAMTPESAGAEFFVPATAHQGIEVAFDVYPDALSSRWLRIQVSCDGGQSWMNHAAEGRHTHGGLYDLNSAAWYRLSADLSAMPCINNNAGFGFRIVSAFSPSAGVYEACGGQSPYSRFGLMFLDMVTVTGKPLG